MSITFLLFELCSCLGREVSEKLDVDYGKKSASVVYVNNKQYIFDPLSSTMNESDVINVPNIMLFVSCISVYNKLDPFSFQRLLKTDL